MKYVRHKKLYKKLLIVPSTDGTVELWTPDRRDLNNLLRLRQQRVTSRPTLADTELTQVTQVTKK